MKKNHRANERSDRTRQAKHPDPPGGQGGLIVAASALSIVLAAMFKVGLLAPVLNALVVFPFFAGAAKANRPRAALGVLARWAATTFVFTAILTVFLPHRAAQSLPFATSYMADVKGWLSVGGMREFRPLFIIEMAAIFAGASLATAGLGGLVVGSTSVMTSAYAFAFLLRHGDNIFHLALLGVPPWVWAFILAEGLMIVPLARFSLSRFYHVGIADPGDGSRHYGWMGLVLVLSAIILALLLEHAWGGLLAGCTLV